MGEEKIHSLYLQRKDTSSHGPSAYRTVPYMETETFFVSLMATETCFRFLDGRLGLILGGSLLDKFLNVGTKPTVA